MTAAVLLALGAGLMLAPVGDGHVNFLPPDLRGYTILIGFALMVTGAALFYRSESRKAQDRE